MKTALFMLSLEDIPDNVLRIVIVYPTEGEEGALFNFDDEETKRDKKKHYGIYIENHILDVIPSSEPSIRKI